MSRKVSRDFCFLRRFCCEYLSELLPGSWKFSSLAKLLIREMPEGMNSASPNSPPSIWVQDSDGCSWRAAVLEPTASPFSLLSHKENNQSGGSGQSPALRAAPTYTWSTVRPSEALHFINTVSTGVWFITINMEKHFLLFYIYSLSTSSLLELIVLTSFFFSGLLTR